MATTVCKRNAKGAAPFCGRTRWRGEVTIVSQVRQTAWGDFPPDWNRTPQGAIVTQWWSLRCLAQPNRAKLTAPLSHGGVQCWS
jgi:hypothetical protein